MSLKALVFCPLLFLAVLTLFSKEFRKQFIFNRLSVFLIFSHSLIFYSLIIAGTSRTHPVWKISMIIFLAHLFLKNWKHYYIFLLLLGFLFNTIVVATNSNKMPISGAVILRFFGSNLIPVPQEYIIMSDKVFFSILGDWIYIPLFEVIASPGDIIIIIGSLISVVKNFKFLPSFYLR